MLPHEIAASYDQIAERWIQDDFPQENGIAQHKRAIAFLREKRRALDIGCGSSGRLIELMLGNGFDVEGVDVSSRMLELAKQRHPHVIFHHADICSWQFPKKYDLISAWDSIWHLPKQEQEPVLKKILENLTPGGVLIFTSGGLDEPAEKVDAAMGPQMYYSVLGIPNTLKLISEAGCICRHLEYDQYPEMHVYFIVQRKKE